jgi:hypothetical protein
MLNIEQCLAKLENFAKQEPEIAMIYGLLEVIDRLKQGIDDFEETIDCLIEQACGDDN